MKACYECKHCKKHTEVWEGRLGRDTYVELRCELTERLCENERGPLTPKTSKCGPEGKLFEPTFGARVVHLFTGEDF